MRSFLFLLAVLALNWPVDPRVGPPAAASTLAEAITEPVGVLPEDPLRFVLAGEPWFPAGYYPALGTFTDGARVAERYYEDYLTQLAANGLNYTRMVFTMGQGYGEDLLPYLRTGPGLAADGKPRVDLDRPNPEHFAYWRDVIAFAEAKGVVVQLVIFDAWHNGHWISERGPPGREWGLKHDFFVAGNNTNGLEARSLEDWFRTRGPVFEAQLAHVARVVDALGAFPNIVWEVANEADVFGGAAAKHWQRVIADFITRREAERGFARHLVMPRDLPNHETVPQHRPQVIAARPIAQPMIVDNDIAIEAYTPEVRRARAWAALTAGAHINFFHFAMSDPGVLASEDVARGMRYVGLTRRFVAELGVDLVGMAPCDERVEGGSCLGRPGEEYVIYLPQAQPVMIPGLPPGDVRATWFDPRTGATQGAGAGPVFTPPGLGDWALHARLVP